MDMSQLGGSKNKYSWVAPVTVFATAITMRLVYIAFFARTEIWGAMMVDAELYDNWGMRIAGGDWIGTKIFYDPPLYAYFLGVIYKIFGHEYIWLRVIQAIIGSVHAVLIFYMAGRILDRRADLPAGLIAVFYKPFVFYDALVMKAFLSSTMVDAGLLTFLIAMKSGKYRWWLLHGIFMGLTTLLRLNIVLFVFFESLIFLLAFIVGKWKGGRVKALLSGLAWFIGFVTMIAPVVARNRYISGKFVLVSSYLGQNFYTGNNPFNTNGNYQRLPFVRANPKYEEEDFYKETERRGALKILTPGMISLYWLGEGVNYIRAQPAAFWHNMWTRFRLYWNAYEVPDSHDIYFITKNYLPILCYLPGFGIIAPLGLIGIILTFYKWRELWPLYVFICVYTASVIIFFVFGRYRLPMMGILVAFSGAALIKLWELKSRYFYFICAAALLGLLFYLVNIAPPYRVPESESFRNMGSLFRQRGDRERAVEYYRKAISIRPGEFESQYFLATTLREMGKCDEAFKEYNVTLTIMPDDPNSYAGIGICFEAAGDDERASEYYLKALNNKAGLVDVRLMLIKLLLKRADRQGAINHLLILKKIDPNNPEAIRIWNELNPKWEEIHK